MPSDCNASARRSTRTSRCTPPERVTEPTPDKPYIALVTESSTNQDSSSNGNRCEETA